MTENSSKHLMCGLGDFKGLEVAVFLSKHSEIRLKERFGFNRKAAKKHLLKVVKEGKISHFRNESCKNIYRITYKENDYLFSYWLPKAPHHKGTLLSVTAINNQTINEFDVYVAGSQKTIVAPPKRHYAA